MSTYEDRNRIVMVTWETPEEEQERLKNIEILLKKYYENMQKWKWW